MDELDKAIADLRKKIVKWEKLLRDGKVELIGLEKAAKLRPSANAVRRPADADAANDGGVFGPAGNQADDGRRPGRRPGAISADWRQVLLLVYMRGGPHKYNEIHEIAKSQTKIDVTDIASTRDRVRGFVNSGLMTGTPEIGFTVTEEAAERFDFDKQISAPFQEILDGAEKAEGT